MVNLAMICPDAGNLFDRNQKYAYFPYKISGYVIVFTCLLRMIVIYWRRIHLESIFCTLNHNNKVRIWAQKNFVNIDRTSG